MSSCRRLTAAFLALSVFWPGLGRGQQADQPPAEQSAGQQEQENKPPKRPTLGPETAESRPTLGRSQDTGGPLTSTTTDARKLLRVHAIYIESMDNALSDRLIEGFAKGTPFRIVAKRSEADAILRGTCFDSRRLKRVHSEVFLSDLRGSPIWQDNILQPFNPPPLAQAVSDTASLIVAHLSESLREAQRR